jgi:hypothetical protein
MSITFRAHLSLVAAAMLAAFGGRYAAAAVVDFEDLALPPSGFFNGDPGNLSPGDSVSQPWTSGGASFANTFGIDVDFAFPYWSGFAYSDVVNTTTNTFDNQYAAYPGSGFQSTTYAIAYSGAAAVSLPSPATVSGFRIANTTYAYLTMQDGDIYGFTQPLAAEGWFLVTASGSLGGTPTGSAVFYLRTIASGARGRLGVVRSRGARHGGRGELRFLRLGRGLLRAQYPGLLRHG